MKYNSVTCSADGYVPFTYLIRFRATGQMYYGVKFGMKAHPSLLWTKYFTSSREVKKLKKDHGHEVFDVEVRQIFKTAQEAKDWEARFLIRVGAAQHAMFFNKHNQNGRFYVTGPMSEPERAKRRKPRKGNVVKPRPPRRTKDFILTSPDGVIYHGNNLNRFCKERQLTQPALTLVCHGKRPHHKGWTGKYC